MIGIRIISKKALAFLVLTLWMTLFWGCSSISVNSDYDQSVNFTKLHTYSLMKETNSKEDGPPPNTLVMSRIDNAIRKQLDMKGFRKVTENPDFLVAYHASVDEKTVFHSTPYYGGGVGFGHVGVAYQDVYQTQYEEGTLIIDILNPQSNTLLWRGTAKGAVDERDNPTEKTQQINEAVAKILKTFPPSPGSNKGPT